MFKKHFLHHFILDFSSKGLTEGCYAMAMHDEIAAEIKTGRIPKRFKLADLMRNPADAYAATFTIGRNTYKKTTITTGLNNLRKGPDGEKGNHVIKGQTPRYRKYSDGSFSLLNYTTVIDSVVPDETGDSLAGEKPRVKKKKKAEEGTLNDNIICDAFIDYLSEKPFRLYLGNGSWYPKKKPVVGWVNRLNAYAWPLKNNIPAASRMWSTTSNKLNNFTTRISKIISNYNNSQSYTREQAALEIYNDIRKWGNPRGSDRTGIVILDAIHTIHAGIVANIRDLELDSTLTKLYAFTKPNDYVIYDSRVAYAIVSIAEDIYRRDKVNEFQSLFPELGHMAGAAQSGTRPRGLRSQWPNAYKNWDAQIQANRLCKCIRDRLNKRKIDEKSDWRLRDVEAVLFMEGY